MADIAPQALVDLAALAWTPERLASARAMAAPNDLRIAAAAAELLTPDDHAATFAAWCDGHPLPAAPVETPR